MARQPARLPIQIVVDNWNARAGQAKAAGVPLEIIKTIGQEDIDRVKQGYTAMSRDQAQASVMGALGKPQVQAKEPTNLGSLPGNAVKDLSGIIRALPQIPGRLLDDVINFGDHPGQSFRELAPIAALAIPVAGPAISSGLLAAQGVEQLVKDPKSAITHPVGTALSFLPAVGVAGKMAGKAGILGEVGTGATRGLVGAKQALAEGHPVRALGRATGVGAVKEDIVGKLGGSRGQREVYRAHSLWNREALGEKYTLNPVDDAKNKFLVGEGTQALVDKYLGPMSRPFDDLVSETERMYKVTPDQAKKMVSDEYTPFHPQEFFPNYEGPYAPNSKIPKREGVTSFHPQQVSSFDDFSDTLMVPKHVGRTIDDMFGKKPEVGSQTKAWKDANQNLLIRPFRGTVLRGPRHVAHVFFGGMAFGMLDNPAMFRELPKVLKEWRNGGLDDVKYRGMMHTAENKMGFEPAVTPPALTGVHATLEAEARRIHSQLQKAPPGAKPQLQKMLDEVEGKIIDLPESPLLPNYALNEKNPVLEKLKKPEDMTGDQLWHTAAGSRMAKMLVDSWTKGQAKIAGNPKSINSARNVAAHPAQALDRFEAAISNIQRAAHFLANEKKGMSPELALKAAHKAFVSADSLSPLERSIMRQVYPFYTFQAHLMKYLKNFPEDHPIRAGIISMMAEQEQKDWDSGLPTHLMNLFYLGQPDEEGNVKVIDIKSTNPFRSMYNGFTLAGFTQGLHPVISSTLKSMGLNIFSASPNLHQEVTFNPDTGRLETTRTEVGNNLATGLIPPLVGLQAAFGLTARLRQLKERDPEAWKRVMLSSFNIPFVVSKENETSVRAEVQRNKLSVAQSDVSKALRTGDPKTLKRYHGSLVPFQGELIDPLLLEQLLLKLKPASEKYEVSPKSLIVRSR